MSGRKKILVGVLVGGAVAGAGVYGYKTSPMIRRNVLSAGRAAKRRVRPVGSFVGGMVGWNPFGAWAHVRALQGAAQGKKMGREFLHGSYNWEKIKRDNPGKRMYSVGL